MFVLVLNYCLRSGHCTDYVYGQNGNWYLKQWTLGCTQISWNSWRFFVKEVGVGYRWLFLCVGNFKIETWDWELDDRL